MLHRLLARHGLSGNQYRISQLRYDLAKLRAKGMVERIDSSRRYRLTTVGARRGALLVKLRIRLLGPLFSIAARSPLPAANPTATVDAAFRKIDAALETLCDALGIRAT